VSVETVEVAPLDEYLTGSRFDLIVLATKAHDAIEVASKLSGLLEPGGTLLPIQNGGVPQMLGECVLGGLSNLGATMTEPGIYEQRNAGHLLIGELAGGESERAERIRQWLGRAVDLRVTPNLRGAVWSKLLLNCSVTSLGAVAGGTMREYITSSEGREVFEQAYDEALSVALASGARPERMIVEPIPPARSGPGVPSEEYDAWLDQILQGYGDVRPSMLQDIERGRITEIDFINGYVVSIAPQFSVHTPVNAAIVETVHAITRGQLAPDLSLLERILKASQ
jgi:2-dehydropantoate 2-reductase